MPTISWGRFRIGTKVTLIVDMMACVKPGDVAIVLGMKGRQRLVFWERPGYEQYDWVDINHLALAK